MRRSQLAFGIGCSLLVSTAVAVSMARRQSDLNRYNTMRQKVADLADRTTNKSGELLIALPGFWFQTNDIYSDRTEGSLPYTPAVQEAKRFRAREQYVRRLANPNGAHVQEDKFVKVLSAVSPVGSGAPTQYWAVHSFAVEAMFEPVRDGKGFVFTGFLTSPMVAVLSEGDRIPDFFERAQRQMKQSGLTYDNIINPEDLNWALGVDDFRTYTPPSYR